MNFTTQMVSPPNRIAIIGAGSVGADIAFALLLGRVAAEIVLVDIDTARCHAQVQDLSDGAFLSSTRVREGSFRDASQCEIIVISAGAKQRPGESKTDLVGRNLDILRAVINDMKPLRQDAILLIVANPVDTLTFFAQCMSGLPKGQVIGTGTFLDTARLRILLAEEIQASKRQAGATLPLTDSIQHDL
jgi:L-lactate dehydrogenase